MTRNELPSPDLLRKLLRYEPETGKLFWRERSDDMFLAKKRSAKAQRLTFNKRFANKEAFTTKCFRGYARGNICGTRGALAHRVIWAMHTGHWPKHQIDHINGNTSDNRIFNLRHVTHTENHKNLKRVKRNSSGFSNVSLCKNTGKWRVRFMVNWRERSFGTFQNKSDAIECAKKAKIALGFHENHGSRQ